MKLDDYCPGCGGGEGNQGCKIARCNKEHGEIEYCYLCKEYPCEKYPGIEQFDSFITHRNQLKDMKKHKRLGKEQYDTELNEKIEILNAFLANYNDGRRKSFFALAVNLMELQEVKEIKQKADRQTESKRLTLKEKAIIAAELFQSEANSKEIKLKLNKKPANK